MRVSALVVLSLCLLTVSAQAQMGRYPCDPDADFIAKIRKVSIGESPMNLDVRAALDLIVDAARHCREEGLVAVMKAFMEGRETKKEAEKKEGPLLDGCVGLRDEDLGITTWQCHDEAHPFMLPPR